MTPWPNSTREWTEFRMDVPWGHISGKLWGSPNNPPVLAIHGWQDNCGTFNTLIPLLPTHLSYLAIDLPGHGFSSHIPAGMTYHKIDYVQIILRVVNFMKWDKVSLLAHSMGGYDALWFAVMFPQKVKTLILLDSLKSPDYSKDSFWYRYGQIIDRNMQIDGRRSNGEEPPSYTYEECIELYYDGAFKSIDKDKCSHIVERNVKKSIKNPEKYYFSRDPRLRVIEDGIFPLDQYQAIGKKLRIPIMYINALKSPEFHADFKGRIQSLQATPLFQWVEIDGRHHVHLNEPEKISDIINPFLIKYAIHMEPKL